MNNENSNNNGNRKKKKAWVAVRFLLFFCIITTILTLIFLPKWDYTDEGGQLVGFYEEPKNSIDVLFLGSCNMYSSMSPVLLYEEYGITGYVLGVPDEEMSVSYYLIKEALKRQKPKAIVVESLALTMPNTDKREYYNRYAFDYIPPSINKIRMMAETSINESAWMKRYDPSSPNALMTFAGYVFPLLRYHGRTDLTAEDYTWFFGDHRYNPYKGGISLYSYNTNEGIPYNSVYNRKEINEMSLKYVPKIKALCEENDIPLIFVKSPNNVRWGYDDEQTKVARDYIEGLGIPFIDMHKAEEPFQEYEYSSRTGRLNIYGVRRFSHEIGKYLTENLGLTPTEMTEENSKAWEECIDWYYDRAEDRGMCITPGEIAQIKNTDDGLQIRWNTVEDAEYYNLMRYEGSSRKVEMIAENFKGDTYDDHDVVSGWSYGYIVVPHGGEKDSDNSRIATYVRLDTPENLILENDDNTVKMSWSEVRTNSSVNLPVKYMLTRREASVFDFAYYDKLTSVNGKIQPHYTNKYVEEGLLHYYRVRAYVEMNGKKYYSNSNIKGVIPQKRPEIIGSYYGPSGITVKWADSENEDVIQVFRKGPDDKDFELLAEVSPKKDRYKDRTVEVGKEYQYCIRYMTESYGETAYSQFSNIAGEVFDISGE